MTTWPRDHEVREKITAIRSEIVMGYSIDDGTGGRGIVLGEKGRRILAEVGEMSFVVVTPEGRMHARMHMETAKGSRR